VCVFTLINYPHTHTHFTYTHTHVVCIIAMGKWNIAMMHAGFVAVAYCTELCFYNPYLEQVIDYFGMYVCVYESESVCVCVCMCVYVRGCGLLHFFNPY
jgi:hypothetical protein